jgi:hypothetical protein
MKTATQPTLPSVRDWREPQTVAPYELAVLITEAAAAGFEATRMEVLKPIAYRVTFQRMPAASDSRNGRPAQYDSPQDFAGNRV